MNKFNYFKDDNITINPELVPFIGEICHRYNAKVLNKISVRQQWGGQYWTMSETLRENDEVDFYEAYVLSSNGFPEIVAWTDGETYYMSADVQLKERSDGKFLNSKRISELIKKFDKRVDLARHNPHSINHWVTGGDYADLVVQDVSSSSKLTKSYSAESMNGAELHLLLNSLINHADISSQQRQLFEDKLQVLDNKYNEVQNASNIVREKLEKPFYIIGKSMMSFRDETCVVWKAKINNSNKFEVIETPKAYRRFEDCPVHDKLRGFTTIFALSYEDTQDDNKKWLLDKIIPNSDHYGKQHLFDADTGVGFFGYIRCHNDFKMVYTYILDVD